MPLPTIVFLLFGIGIAAALAAGSDLRLSPRPALLTRSFAAYAIFVVLVVIPISVYFYVFYGDWFLLYLVDVSKVPSALALLGFIAEAALGALGFLTGASLSRSQRVATGAVLALLCGVPAAAVALLAPQRLGVVGSYAQFRGGFGLEPYHQGAVMQSGVVMGSLLVIGTAFLLWRLHAGGRWRV